MRFSSMPPPPTCTSCGRPYWPALAARWRLRMRVMMPMEPQSPARGQRRRFRRTHIRMYRCRTASSRTCAVFHRRIVGLGAGAVPFTALCRAAPARASIFLQLRCARAPTGDHDACVHLLRRSLFAARMVTALAAVLPALLLPAPWHVRAGRGAADAYEYERSEDESGQVACAASAARRRQHKQRRLAAPGGVAAAPWRLATRRRSHSSDAVLWGHGWYHSGPAAGTSKGQQNS
jgi:hypothetical protein